jgi:hypothetical protein
MDRVVYTFRMISNEEDDFQRDFEIRADHTFFDLHLAIQKNLGYDKSQMASFVLTNDKWERETEITLFDMSDEPSEDALIMDKVSVGKICIHRKQKLLYIFDFFSDRCFFIELVKIEDADPHVTYPKCILAKGKIPVQIIMEDNNIDGSPVEEFDDLENFDDDLSFENLDDFNDF